MTSDATGKKFVHLNVSENDKNHGVNDEPFDTVGEGRIYETGNALCPVRSFEKYLSVLNPNCDSMWQRPRDIFTTDSSEPWYCNVPLGQDMLVP